MRIMKAGLCISFAAKSDHSPPAWERHCPNDLRPGKAGNPGATVPPEGVGGFQAEGYWGVRSRRRGIVEFISAHGSDPPITSGGTAYPNGGTPSRPCPQAGPGILPATPSAGRT